MQICFHHTNLDPNGFFFANFLYLKLFGAALRNICNVNEFICHTLLTNMEKCLINLFKKSKRSP